MLVFVLFAGLWLCFATVIAFRRAELDEPSRAFRRRSVLVQAVGWLLFLLFTAGLLVWERRGQLGLPVGLVLVIATVNLLMFFRRG